MGKYLGFNSEEEYDESIERDAYADAKQTSEQFAFKEYQRMLADPEAAKQEYGELYDRTLAALEKLFSKRTPIVASSD